MNNAAHGVTVAGSDAAAPLILTLDIGSSSTRAALYDRLARRVVGAEAAAPNAFVTGSEGLVEADPIRLLATAAECIDAVLAQAGALAQQIAAVAVDTFVSNILPVDDAGEPLAPLITYADTRNAGDADALRHALDERTVHDRTGCLLRTSYWPPRLAWFRRTQPDLWRRVARWITLGEHLEERWFGRCRVSFSAASWSGLLDRRALVWDDALLDLLGVGGEQLSPLVDIDAPLTGLVEPFASRWPALRAIPWLPAVGDGAAANIGSGCTGHARMALTLGTTGALRVVQPTAAELAPGLWCYRVDRHHALVGGATSEGGNVYAWMQETLRLGDPAALEAALAAMPPDGHGLTVLPFFAGERSPDWAGNVQATIHGLTLATTPAAIVRAGMEAVAYRFALIEQRLCGQPACGHRLIASGGALPRSPVWSQIFADVLGRPLVLSAEPEATSRGASLLALHVLGQLPDLAALPAADGAVFTPDLVRHAVYQAAIARQRTLYAQIIGNGRAGQAVG
jgi:gluconokinase